ncbi:hypothetical protein [Flaviaesturariibacter aridisoli]|uniref:NnrS family protein n=1 Tax=Flaviaesturariibacter aridisoli TaxID=2545761 RepID=A0A4R4DXJ9_9BACT|nr:hypothetical protein [Flaviaesturariibacter aridisoli]TCZ66519.1 hypothetical protein E0486_16520 [Flaviaesturariibacter aridisoli]
MYLRSRPASRVADSLLRVALACLLLVALLGLLLRAAPFLPALPFSYHNLLHAHSHFAFGGWVHPVLLALLLRAFPELRTRIRTGHWIALAVLLPVSALGMLLTFPVQGYGPASIAFSTLSLLAGFYEAALVFRALKGLPATPARRFFRAAMGWMILSAIGPFATGPITASGGLGSPLYYNAIYGYLHFQYNGCFSLLVLALWYRSLEKEGRGASLRAFRFFHWAVLPTYALSLLWNSPPLLVHAIGGGGALLQAAGFICLLRDSRGVRRLSPLLVLSAVAMGGKLLLQLLSALPAVALLAAAQRPFVIAYLHLVLLGFITLFVFAQLPASRLRNLGTGLFLASFVSTELLLVGQGLGWMMPHPPVWLLACSVPFPLGVLLLLLGQIRAGKRKSPVRILVTVNSRRETARLL